MNQIRSILIASIILASPLFALAGAGPQETEIPGVIASIAYIRQYNGVLHLGIALKNSNKSIVHTPGGFKYSEVVIVDPKANQKHYALKDADGHYLAGPITDWIDGGRWSQGELFPESDTLLWILFDAVGPGSKVTVQLPSPLQSFSDLVVTGGPRQPGSEVVSSPPPLRATLVSADRAAGQLTARVKIFNPGGNSGAYYGSKKYEDAFALDPIGKRKYPLLKDAQNNYVASPMSDQISGGRWSLSKVAPGGQAFMNLTFQAPPDSIKTVDVVLPWFNPFEAVEISGTGEAKESGVAVAGKSLELERAMKDLAAEETPKEIKINLSADVLFDFDKADLKPEAEPSLEKVATVLKANVNSQVAIEGHADGKGSESYNQTLSEKRAATIAQWFITHHDLDAAHVHIKGWGKSKPIAPNTKPDGSDDPEGRARNRRVEIVVTRQ